MVIVVTGEIGIGKTTICEKVNAIAKRLGYSCGGILTPKSKKGIDVLDIQTGKSKPLASLTNIYQGPHIGKYFFNPEGINFGIKAIDRGISADILFVDEVGHLELQGEGFAKIIELIRAGKVKKCILVIRQELLPTFSARLGPKLIVVEATTKNRNKLPQKIGALLNLGKAGSK